MQEAQHTPNGQIGETKVFYPLGSTIAQGVQTWYKPKWATMINFVAVGGGAGGGAGFTRTAGTAGGGGGSGASSGIARFLVPAIFVPDVLYIQVGAGGKGGVPGVSSGNGVAGVNSYISTSPPLTAGTVAPLPNIWLNSGVTAPGAGGGGAVGAAGAAGTVPTIAVVQPHHLYGQWMATVGLVGIIGGVQTGAAGTGPTAWAANMFSPGGSGAGCTTTDFAGGPVTLTARYVVPGKFEMATTAIPAGTSPGGNGNPGIKSFAPFLNCGGSGGASNNSGQAGHGANGGYGCGGGGGGAGATAGNGGNGGDGLVIISCF